MGPGTHSMTGNSSGLEGLHFRSASCEGDYSLLASLAAAVVVAVFLLYLFLLKDEGHLVHHPLVKLCVSENRVIPKSSLILIIYNKKPTIFGGSPI